MEAHVIGLAGHLILAFLVDIPISVITFLSRVSMESSCYGFTMVLVFLIFLYSPVLVLPASSIVENFFLHVCNSFVDPVVPVITFFSHFLNG